MKFKTNLLQFLFYAGYLLLVLLQISFIQNIASLGYYLNLIFILSINLLFRNAVQKLFICLISAGFIYDLYSRFTFGVYLFTFCLTFLILYLIMQRIFTSYENINNFIIIIIGTILWQIIPWIFTRLIYSLNLNDYQIMLDWKKFLAFIITNLVLSLIILRGFKKIKRHIWINHETY